MSFFVGDGVMAKIKGRPKKPGGEGAQVRIDADLAKWARFIAIENGGTVTEYLSKILRPVIERDIKRAKSNFFGGKDE